jgi:uncharacterized repeat protein (TIGR04138 family)
MSMHQSRLAEIVRRDPRYPYEAYEFLFAALAYTQKLLDRVPHDVDPADVEPRYHVSGRELLDGIRQYALREFGLMARTVFRLWGINRTDDIGEIVFNLVEEKLLSKTDRDRREDFHDVFDLDQALVEGFRIEFDETEWKP